MVFVLVGDDSGCGEECCGGGDSVRAICLLTVLEYLNLGVQQVCAERTLCIWEESGKMHRGFINSIFQY